MVTVNPQPRVGGTRLRGLYLLEFMIIKKKYTENIISDANQSTAIKVFTQQQH